MKTKPFFEISLSENIKGEWEMKEYGSYEDAGKPKQGHIVNILNHSPKGKLVANNEIELAIIEMSASYHNGAWDRDENIVINFMRSCSRICDKINSLKIAMAEDNLNTLNKELREINRSIDLQETNMNDDLVSTKQVKKKG